MAPYFEYDIGAGIDRVLEEGDVIELAKWRSPTVHIEILKDGKASATSLNGGSYFKGNCYLPEKHPDLYHSKSVLKEVSGNVIADHESIAVDKFAKERHVEWRDK